MNKTIQDIECCMKTEVNIDDELSLGYFRTCLGFNRISNKAETIKRCGEFERHDQFVLEVGQEILISAFKTFIEDKNMPVNKNIEDAQNLILRFLDESDIKYFYDTNNFDEKPAPPRHSIIYFDWLFLLPSHGSWLGCPRSRWKTRIKSRTCSLTHNWYLFFIISKYIDRQISKPESLPVLNYTITKIN